MTFVDPISNVENTVNPWFFWEGRFLTEIATLQLSFVVFCLVFFFFFLKTVLLSL